MTLDDSLSSGQEHFWQVLRNARIQDILVYIGQNISLIVQVNSIALNIPPSDNDKDVAYGQCVVVVRGLAIIEPFRAGLQFDHAIRYSTRNAIKRIHMLN